MDQITFDGVEKTTDEERKELLYEFLCGICEPIGKELSDEKVFFVEKSVQKSEKTLKHQHAISVNLLSMFVLRILIQKTSYKLIYNDTSEKFSALDENFRATVERIARDAIINYQPAEMFGCCSRYLECSDNKKCTHPDKLYVKGCQYKLNLDAGRIFYGKNRNID